MYEAAATVPPWHGEGDRAKRGGGGATSLRNPAVYTARKLRREMTLPEVLLWQQLRGKPLGLKFRRQHPVDPYVVDFYCREAALVVEIDGAAHDGVVRSSADAVRDQRLRERGLTVARIAAADVLRDPVRVAQSIIERVGSPLHQPSAGPPPRAGEDLS